MNDRPTSGQYPDHGYDGLSTTTFAGDSGYASYETQGQGFNYAAYGSYETGAYDTTAWAPQTSYPQQPQQSQDGYTGYDGYLSTVPAQSVPEDAAWSTQAASPDYPSTDYPSTDYQSTGFGYATSAEQTGQWSAPGYDTGAYDATAWNTASEQTASQQTAYAYGYDQQEQPQQQEQQQYAYETYEAPAPVAEATYDEPYDPPYTEAYAGTYTETSVFGVVTDDTENDAENAANDAVDPVHDLPTQAMPITPSEPRASRRAGAKPSGRASTSKTTTKASTGSTSGNSRRRTPAKRSALLTVAVPSACVMGVAGVAAASVGGLTGTEKPAEETTTLAAPDPASVKPVAANSKLDTQLTALSADAGDFADRASRTQERIDLRQRQDDEKKKKAEEEAAKEAARPKFSLPVDRHGLSAGFGQAGVNWMSVHTGIDFPVSYGTSVKAATDGTVRSQWNSAYGNMVILTAPDGTETWYCHLSSAKIRSGKVKAGDVIAYSGNSGNSTGPHLHFEVRPGGGSPIDPQAWLRSHDLDPT